MSNFIKNLPTSLINRYKLWKETHFEENKVWYNKLSQQGQNPSTMVISCCDSRINVTSMFGANIGEFFIHRNIANLVPPYNPNGDHHGTSAALEYAVINLKVSNIIVIGHSNCGGIASGYYLCKDKSIISSSIFIDKWLNILKPAFKKILIKQENLSESEQILKLEKESIKISLQNLTDFPFIKNQLNKKTLSLHGMWHDIGKGELEYLDSNSLNFRKI